jgi:hypothetical protein
MNNNLEVAKKKTIPLNMRPIMKTRKLMLENIKNK